MCKALEWVGVGVKPIRACLCSWSQRPSLLWCSPAGAVHDKPGSTCSRIGSKVPAPHKPEGRDPDHQEGDSPLDHRDAEQGLWEVPSSLEEGSGMKPLWRTSIPPADLEIGQGAGGMSKP